MEIHVGSDVLRVLEFYCSFLGHARVHQPIWVWIMEHYYNITDINFFKYFQKLSVFQIHYFQKVYYF